MPTAKQASQASGVKAPMPAWSKPPAELVAFFKAFIADFPQAEPRTMFGYPCAMVNGYLTTGVFADRVYVRLDEAAARELLQIAGATAMEPTPGRIMKGYVMVPERIRTTTLGQWVQRAIDYSSSLPRKEKKK